MEFKGTLKTGGGEFKSPGDGTHLMGLISIKDCVKKFKGEERPGIQFTFKSAGDPDALVCHRLSCSLNVKSNLYKTLRRMAPKAVSEATTGEQAKELLGKLEDQWYMVDVVEAPGKDGRIFANVDDCMIKPCPPDQAPKDKPSAYFQSAKTASPAPKQDEDDINF
jgi:hypothetical protein